MKDSKTETLKVVKNVLRAVVATSETIESDLRSGEDKTFEIDQNLAEINELLLDCIKEIDDQLLIDEANDNLKEEKETVNLDKKPFNVTTINFKGIDEANGLLNIDWESISDEIDWENVNDIVVEVIQNDRELFGRDYDLFVIVESENLIYMRECVDWRELLDFLGISLPFMNFSEEEEEEDEVNDDDIDKIISELEDDCE